MNLLILFFLLAQTAFAGDPIEGVVPITLSLQSGNFSGNLYSESVDASIAPGNLPVQTTKYYIRYRWGQLRFKHYISREEANEIISTSKNFASPNTKYSVSRSTDGYSAGEALSVTVYGKENGGLRRYSNYDEAKKKRLLLEYQEKDPLVTLVDYDFKDAARENVAGTEKMDPHGRILMGDEGEIKYLTYNKPVPIFEFNTEDGRPRLGGTFPSIADALAKAKVGKTSELRFAADFGPQYHGVAARGDVRANQLMPLIPLGEITNPKTKEKFVVALPPDQLQAYRRGELGMEILLLIPPAALRYVPSVEGWNYIIDDYLELRASGRDPERIFVANRKGAQAGDERQTSSLNSIKIFGRDRMEESLKDFKASIPPSILNLELDSNKKRNGSSKNCISPLGGLP